jgi:hypothetical protein
MNPKLGLIRTFRTIFRPGHRAGGLCLEHVADPGNQSGNFRLEANLTPEQVSSFLAGAYYINIHTQANPPGELRAQVVFPR